ncbi:RpnC/YadD family protein [Nocardia macrotermitis]|uniref:DUF4351 domain-containing protein n=1 Tax=Nocardia macrotermitis TaxID=2585198 RepID=A0A7K0D731_9NOCA|nr:hypothetical protein [Nocardia macrotermitis]MQY21570.1 hypothetical protein [Nocardia macrotermitis]
MTTEQQIEARGMARGIELAEARGRAEVLIEVLDAKFGPLPTTLERRVQAATPEQVRTWLAQVLTVTTLDEMFA